MPLLQGKSKKSFEKNVSAEMDAGKPQKQSLAIAFNIKRHAAKKKMAQGGMAENPKFDMEMLDKHPLEHRAEARAGFMRPDADNAEDDRDEAMMMAEGGEIRAGSMRPDVDNAKSERDMHELMGRSVMEPSELRAGANRPDIDTGDEDESRDMMMELGSKPSMMPSKRAGSDMPDADSALDMIDTIMMRRKMASGGMVDDEQVDQHANQDEGENLEDDLSYKALHSPMKDSMIDDMDQPMDSNEMGDEREKDSENEHDADMVSQIMKKRRK